MSDEQARKARAERLRRQIRRMADGEPSKKAPDEASKPESARDFVHRRMRELNDKKE